MTSVVRYTLIQNGTGAALTSANADSGDDFSAQIVKRIFVAADIGTGAGQLKDASNPTVGCLVAQFRGSRVMDVKISLPYRASAATVTVFRDPVVGTAANTSKLGYRVAYDAKTGISSVYVLDRAAAAPGAIVADDWIFITPLIGSSANTNVNALPLG